MLLFALATLAVVAFGAIAAASLNLPSRAAIVIATMVLTFVSIAVLVQVTLLLGSFTRPVVATLALLLPVVGGTVAMRTPRLRENVGRSAAAFRAPVGEPADRRPVLSVAAGASATALLVAYVNRIWVDLRIPPLDWDSNNYHLVSAANWVATGRLGTPIAGLKPPYGPTPLAWIDSYPHQSELMDAWLAVFPHSSQLTTLLQVPFAALMVAAAYGLCRIAGCNRRVAFIAASIVGLIPITLAQVTTSYNDVVRSSTLVAGWYFLVLAFNRAGESRRAALLFLSGTALGFSAAVKASSLPALGVALVTVLVAGAWIRSRDEPGNPERASAGSRPFVRAVRATAAFGLPAALIGSFWYIRTWTRWGSPFWPIHLGPVAGPLDLSGMSGGRQSTMANVVDMFRGWGDALSAMSSGVLYDAQHGSLGPVWLLILAPAVVAASVMWRRHRTPLVTIVYPILLINLYNGTRVQPRYVLAITVAGAVAFGIVLEALSSQIGKRRCAGGASVALISSALALTLWGASAAVLKPNWAFMPGGGVVAPTHYWAGVDQYFDFMTSSARVRRSADFWRDIGRVEAGIPSGATIGLASDAPPKLVAPWMGTDFEHPLALMSNASSLDQLVAEMRASRVQYIVVGAGPMSDRIAHDASHRFERMLPSARCLDYNTCEATYVWRLVG